MARRPCITPGCTRLAAPGKPRCNACQQQVDRAKWSTNPNRDPAYRAARAAVAASLPVPCGLCGGPIDHIGHDAKALTLDHIVAWSDGGTNSHTNLRPAHKGCNSARGRGM
jgi:5-methylcytosine-specific restriction endonuclease McrA